MLDFVVVGAGGHAASVAEAIISSGNAVKAFVDETGNKKEFMGYPVAKSCEALIPSGGNVVVAIGDNHLRRQVVERLCQNKQYRFPAVVHASANIGLNTAIAEGTVVLAQANLGTNAELGAFSLLNTKSSLDHDGFLGAFSSLAPSAITGGNVTIGEVTAIGIGATISHRTSIGSYTVVGGASFVNKDLPANVVAYGVPCKIVRHRDSHAPYL